MNLEIDPAAGPVDGGEPVAVFGLVGHPGQGLDVDTLNQEVAAWGQARNARARPVN